MSAMKLLIESAMIFFGTLLAAGLVALGEPGRAAPVLQSEPTHASQAWSPMLETVWLERPSAVQPGR
jgi:hypothetical protein